MFPHDFYCAAGLDGRRFVPRQRLGLSPDTIPQCHRACGRPLQAWGWASSTSQNRVASRIYSNHRAWWQGESNSGGYRPPRARKDRCHVDGLDPLYPFPANDCFSSASIPGTVHGANLTVGLRDPWMIISIPLILKGAARKA